MIDLLIKAIDFIPNLLFWIVAVIILLNLLVSKRTLN